MDKYRFTLETKNGISESKANSIFDYLKIIGDQIGMWLRKETICQPKNSPLPTAQEVLKDSHAT